LALREALAGVDPDRLSPREALEAIYRLKALAAATPPLSHHRNPE